MPIQTERAGVFRGSRYNRDAWYVVDAPARTRRPVLAEEDRWATARRLLNDDTLAISTRLIGLLAVTYGIAVTRIVSLTLDRIVDTSDEVTITFGTDPLSLPDPIAAILRAHLAAAGSPFANTRWLFPGRRPGDHLTARVAAFRLGQAGVETRAAQASALLDIARNTPRSVMADLLGISIRHASQLANTSGRDWIDYPSLDPIE